MTQQTAQIGTRSVLFTDLVGSTELRVRLGEDAADTMRRAHDRLLTEAIKAHGGTVVKGLGDGLMATFESAADVVAGAVAAQQAVEQHRRRAPEQAFAVRVGASIGDVSTEREDVFGVPVVEASRLCAMARGGEILTADVVRALARGRGEFVFEPMGELNLKGLHDPVPSCRVVWEPILETPVSGQTGSVPVPAALLGAATTYVGREGLRTRLDGEWHSVRGGATRTVLLAGEPGVGKTRTAAELARAAFAEGAIVLYGRCDEELDVPYQPFVEALEHYVRHADEPVLGRLPGELTRLVPDLWRGLAHAPTAVTSDPASEEYRLFEASASWLIELARSSGPGLVLVLDDIHWATKPTLQLMQHVVRVAADEAAPLLVLATYRDTDIDRTHPLSAVLADLRRLPGIDRIAVDNLTSAEVLAFIETAAGQELDDSIRRVAHTIYAETEGNPFFVGEVLRHLIETHAVRREGELWVVVEPDRIAVPEGVRDVVGRRLNRLSAAANAVLSVAAVLGRDFAVETLLAVTDVGEDDALDALDLAVRARLVEETSVDRYRFAHALVRTTLYEELSATRRRRVHRRVADVLEKLTPTDVRALAYHCTEAGTDGGDDGRAVRYTIAAAEQSLAARAFADAETGFRVALELLEDGGDQVAAARVAAQCGLGESQRDQSDPGYRQTLLDASAEAVLLGDAALLARAVLANTRGFVLASDVDSELLVLIERALELIGPEVTPQRTRLVGQLANELTWSGEPERRLALADEAAAMARSLGDPALLGEVLATTAYASSTGGAWAALLARAEEMSRLTQAGGDPTLRVVSHAFFSGAVVAAGDIERADRLTREMVQLAQDEATPVLQWATRAMSVRLLALVGRLDEAQELATDLAALGRQLGQQDSDQWFSATMAGIASSRGQGGLLADAAGEFARALPLGPIWRTAHVWLLAEAGRADEARAVLREHNLDPQDMLTDPLPFAATFQLAFAAWYLDDEILAASVVRVLDPYRGCWAHYFTGILGPISWALALTLAVTGARDEAVALLEETLADAGERGFHGLTPSMGLHLGEILLSRNAGPDRERAETVLRQARDRAEQVGAPGVVERIDALKPAGS
ncbi:MAG: AAA family ATPase [Lapillicoccus sp.]